MVPKDIETILRIAGADLGADPDEMIGLLAGEDESVPPLEELQRIEAQLWPHFNAWSPTLGGSSQHAQLVASTWVAQTYRQAHAAFLLREAELPESALANARCAVEHGVYLSLLAAVDSVDDVLDPLELEHAHHTRVVFPTEEGMPEFLPLLMKALTSVAGSRDPDVAKFEKVCRRLVTGDVVYRHYRMLSNVIHPGFGSASPFFLSAFAAGDFEDAVPVMEPAPLGLGDRVGLWLALGACGWAGWSADRLFGTEYFGPLLDATVRALGFIPLIISPPNEAGIGSLAP